jgi:hypothetical protein
MFTALELHFTGPLCSCLQQNLSWNFEGTTRGDEGLWLVTICRTCGTRHEVPYRTMTAALTFKNTYPEGIAPPPPAPTENDMTNVTFLHKRT